MILSSDELEIIEYLKSWKGKYVNLAEICRCAGGRKKFREDENWARPFMVRLVDAKLIEVNDRGHYRVVPPNPAEKSAQKKKMFGVLGDDYFPQPRTAALIGEDYFPAAQHSDTLPEDWFSQEAEEMPKPLSKKTRSR